MGITLIVGSTERTTGEYLANMEKHASKMGRDRVGNISFTPSTEPHGSGSSNITGEHGGQIHLWQFLLEMLCTQSSYGNHLIRHLPQPHQLQQPLSASVPPIVWEGGYGEFRVVDPHRLAQLWGERKRRPNMNYDKLTRSLRYYYDKHILAKVRGRPYCYRFDFLALLYQGHTLPSAVHRQFSMFIPSLLGALVPTPGPENRPVFRQADLIGGYGCPTQYGLSNFCRIQSAHLPAEQRINRAPSGCLDHYNHSSSYARSSHQRCYQQVGTSTRLYNSYGDDNQQLNASRINPTRGYNIDTSTVAGVYPGMTPPIVSYVNDNLIRPVPTGFNYQLQPATSLKCDDMGP